MLTTATRKSAGSMKRPMPPLSTSRVDVAGVELLTEWCKSLKGAK